MIAGAAQMPEDRGPGGLGCRGRAGASAGEGHGRRGLDWPGLIRAGLCGLGLKPGEFWDLTPAELALMLGIDFGAGGMTRSRLDNLMAQFPDRSAGGG